MNVPRYSLRLFVLVCLSVAGGVGVVVGAFHDDWPLFSVGLVGGGRRPVPARHRPVDAVDGRGTEDMTPSVWTCPVCGVTNAHTTCPTLRCTGKRK